MTPVYHFDKAKVILSLDSDFIGGEDDAHNHIARFAKGRKPENGGMSRLYAIESLFTLTGTSADHRLRIPAGLVEEVAAAILTLVSGQPAAVPAGVDGKWIYECTKDLVTHRGDVLVVAGQRQPIGVHLIAQAINAALGSVNRTVTLILHVRNVRIELAELAGKLNAGAVDALVVLGGNPVYNAPAALNWAAVQRKAKTVVRLGYYEDETFSQCDWHFPAGALSGIVGRRGGR